MLRKCRRAASDSAKILKILKRIPPSARKNIATFPASRGLQIFERAPDGELQIKFACPLSEPELAFITTGGNVLRSEDPHILNEVAPIEFCNKWYAPSNVFKRLLVGLQVTCPVDFPRLLHSNRKAQKATMNKCG